MAYIYFIAWLLKRYNNKNPHKDWFDFTKKKMVKVNLPLLLTLPEKSSTNAFECISCSVNSYKFLAFWGVSIDQLNEVLYQPWKDISFDIDRGTLLHGFFQHQESPIRYPSHMKKVISLPLPPVPVELDPTPRCKYPLVIFQVRDFVANAKPKENMALVTLINVANEDNYTNNIQAQYFKQANGTVTCLEKMYVPTFAPEDPDPTDSAEDIILLREPGLINLLESNSTEELEEANVSQRELVLLPQGSNNTISSDISDLPYDGPIGGGDIVDVEQPSYVCIVCRNAPLTYGLKPCNHACLCKSCFFLVTSCPFCRGPIKSYFYFEDNFSPGAYLLETDTISHKLLCFLSDFFSNK